MFDRLKILFSVDELYLYFIYETPKKNDANHIESD